MGMTRDCFGCKHSKDNHNAGIEECHLCMWENQCTPTIPYLMHKEMDIPLLECKEAYDVAIGYLRSKGKVSG